MKTKKCSHRYVAAMCAMPSSSDAQNASLKRDLIEGLSLEDCFVKVREDQVICRAVLFKDINYIAYITIEDIAQTEIDNFIQDICSSLDGNIDWRTDLYADKIHYTKLYNALQKCFPIEIKRESYTCVTSKQDVVSYTFQSVLYGSKEAVIHLMMKATKSTLDHVVQREQHLLGLHEAMEKMYQELIENKDSATLFQLLYIEGVAVGFIAINELLKGTGGIGYIGVDPLYQGNHYSTILLRKGIDMAYTYGIHKLIGDIDVDNFAIAYNLQQTGFVKDCNESVFLRPKKK